MFRIKISLTKQILLAIAAGLASGFFFGDGCAVLAPFATAYINIMQVMVIPYMIISLVAGIGSLTNEQLLTIGIKGAALMAGFLALITVAVFAMQLSFSQLHNVAVFSTPELTNVQNFNIVDMFFPTNPFYALSSGMIPAVVLFCIGLGLALVKDNERQLVTEPLNVFGRAVTRINLALVYIIPYGTFVIIAKSTGTLSGHKVAELQIFVIAFTVASLILVFGLFPLLIYCSIDSRLRVIYRAALKALLLGLTTGNLFITLPFIQEGVQKLLAANDDKDAEMKASASVVLPIAFTFPAAGKFAALLFILFTGWFYDQRLGLSDQLLLIFAGIPSLFGSDMTAVTFLLRIFHLPSDAFELYFIAAPVRVAVSLLSCMFLFTFTTICVALVSGKIRLRRAKLAVVIGLTIVLFAAAIGGLRYGFKTMLAGQVQSNGKIMTTVLPARISSWPETRSLKVQIAADTAKVDSVASDTADALRRIRVTRQLRVGVDKNALPFGYLNNQGSLVGYDVDMAYGLAGYLGCERLEFVLADYSEFPQLLANGKCDIVMAGVPINSKTMQAMRLSGAYISSVPALITRDANIDSLDSGALQYLRTAGLGIAVVRGTGFAELLGEYFPAAKIVEVDSIQDYLKTEPAELLFTSVDEGKPWTLINPFFSAYPLDKVTKRKVLYAYGMSLRDSDALALTVNEWLQIEKDSGRMAERYDYWMLAKTTDVDDHRWSVVRDVLHWQ